MIQPVVPRGQPFTLHPVVAFRKVCAPRLLVALDQLHHVLSRLCLRPVGKQAIPPGCLQHGLLSSVLLAHLFEGPLQDQEHLSVACYEGFLDPLFSSPLLQQGAEVVFGPASRSLEGCCEVRVCDLQDWSHVPSNVGWHLPAHEHGLHSLWSHVRGKSVSLPDRPRIPRGEVLEHPFVDDIVQKRCRLLVDHHILEEMRLRFSQHPPGLHEPSCRFSCLSLYAFVLEVEDLVFYESPFWRNVAQAAVSARDDDRCRSDLSSRLSAVPTEVVEDQLSQLQRDAQLLGAAHLAASILRHAVLRLRVLSLA